MKTLILFPLLLTVTLAFGEENKKIYTQKDFDEKVEKELDKQVDRIKKSSVATLTKEILEKERALKEREKALEKREEQIKLGEESLAKRVLEVEGRQKKILGCIDDNQRKEAMRIKQLVSVISNMKPAKAAELLSVQESSISVKIIEQIQPERASKIFNLMDKEVSARLQKQYLNMRQ